MAESHGNGFPTLLPRMTMVRKKNVPEMKRYRFIVLAHTHHGGRHRLIHTHSPSSRLVFLILVFICNIIGQLKTLFKIPFKTEDSLEGLQKTYHTPGA